MAKFKDFQELFNHVYHFILQQGPAISDEGTCQYLTSSNKRCAVGCLYSREDAEDLQYRIGNRTALSLHEGDLKDLVDEMPHSRYGLSELKVRLRQLQVLHDAAAASHDKFESKYRSTMNEQAEVWGIKINER